MATICSGVLPLSTRFLQRASTPERQCDASLGVPWNSEGRGDIWEIVSSIGGEVIDDLLGAPLQRHSSLQHGFYIRLADFLGNAWQISHPPC